MYGTNDWRDYLEHYNHNHDPKTGQFTTSSISYNPQPRLSIGRNIVNTLTGRTTNKDIDENNRDLKERSKTYKRAKFRYKNVDLELNYPKKITDKEIKEFVTQIPRNDKINRKEINKEIDSMNKADPEWRISKNKYELVDFGDIHQIGNGMFGEMFYYEPDTGHYFIVEYDYSTKDKYRFKRVSFEG